MKREGAVVTYSGLLVKLRWTCMATYCGTPHPTPPHPHQSCRYQLSPRSLAPPVWSVGGQGFRGGGALHGTVHEGPGVAEAVHADRACGADLGAEGLPWSRRVRVAGFFEEGSRTGWVGG